MRGYHQPGSLGPWSDIPEMSQIQTPPPGSIPGGFGAETSPMSATVIPVLHGPPTRGAWDFLTLGIAAAAAFFAYKTYKATSNVAPARRTRSLARPRG